MSWTSIRVTAGDQREAAIAALFAAGADGVHEDGADVVTHFPPDTDIAVVAAAVAAAVPTATVLIGKADDTDWSVAWRERIPSHDLGLLTVAPPWLAGALDQSRSVIIEPGMAFGTGDHPTTRGCIRLMQKRLASGLVVADLGAGSAVLSIAAAKLGASQVFAIEYDADAIENAEDNVRRNGVEDRVTVFEGDAAVLLPIIAPVDFVVANIISSVLVELLPAIHAALRSSGEAILSGILLDEREFISETLISDGWTVTDEDREEAWWSVAIAK